MNTVDMKALMLELIGAYSKVQDTIDFAGDFFFRRKTPELANFVHKGAISRMRDDDRPVLFAALVAELKVAGDFSNFATVFRRVKKVRDLASHSVHVDLIDSNTVEIGKSWIAGADGTTTSHRFTRDEIEARLKDCEWLTQCVLFVVTVSDLTNKVFLGGTQVTFPIPPSDPADWDGHGIDVTVLAD